MRTLRTLLTLLLFLLIIAAGRESAAVIYKYANEQGDIAFVDDLQKVPEQLRAAAVRVSGEDAAPERQTGGRIPTAGGAAAALQAQASDQANAGETFRSRLVLSGGSVAAVVALMFLLPRIDVVRERTRVLNGIRAGMIVALLILVPVVHYNDLAPLFRNAGETLPNPFSEVSEQQAARGRKAAEAMKAFSKMLDQADQKAQEDAQRIEKAFEEAEQGK